MGTLGRTWALYKQSFAVLNADVELVLFPVMSTLAAVLLAAGFLIPSYQSGMLKALGQRSAGWEGYAFIFAWYFLNSFIIIFFNSALVGCANIRLSGGDPTVSDGLRIAARHIGKIAAWALVASTVGMLLSSLRDRKGLLGKLLASGLGIAWTLITYLIIPVIILEERGILESIQRSGDLFRKRWGEEVAGDFGFGFLSLFLLLPGAILALMVFPLDRALAVIIAVWYIAILAAITSAVKGVFTVVLFRYASTGEVPGGYAAETIDGMIRRK
jgi:hypothetical protein